MKLQWQTAPELPFNGYQDGMKTTRRTTTAAGTTATATTTTKKTALESPGKCSEIGNGL